MKDETKTKRELIKELIAARRQFAKTEKLIEKLKRAEETLKQKEGLFKFFVESSPIAMALMEGNPPKIKYINQMFARLFGYSADEIPDMTRWWSLAYPDNHYRKRVMSAWNRQVAESPNTPFEVGPVERIITCKDGSKKPVEFRMVSLGTTYISFGVDLTERLKVDEESKEKEERFNALFNRSFDFVYIHDFEGHFLDMNQTGLDFLGYQREDLNSLTVASLFDEDQQIKAVKAVQEIIQTGSQRHPNEYYLRTKEGRRVYFETKGSIIYKDHKPYAILGVARDITGRKEAEELLKKREEELNIRTLHLEETNTALNVLLRQREKDKTDLEEKITANIREMVSPYIEKLKSLARDEIQKTYLNLIKSHLEDITSPFLQNIKSKYMNFTPTEVRVATLIREGKNSKEIGQLINISERTVEFHRNNIRSKLGVNNKPINLRTYLLTFQ
ncbi:MAG: PAS domain S-box protein [Deltaproteobacteria bacterium]|nr:PAS domain S-box protein [Deltaproteobacteria bacterium]